MPGGAGGHAGGAAALGALLARARLLQPGPGVLLLPPRSDHRSALAIKPAAPGRRGGHPQGALPLGRAGLPRGRPGHHRWYVRACVRLCVYTVSTYVRSLARPDCVCVCGCRTLSLSSSLQSHIPSQSGGRTAAAIRPPTNCTTTASTRCVVCCSRTESTLPCHPRVLPPRCSHNPDPLPLQTTIQRAGASCSTPSPRSCSISRGRWAAQR